MPRLPNGGFRLDDESGAKGYNPYEERIKERKKKEKEELEKKE